MTIDRTFEEQRKVAGMITLPGKYCEKRNLKVFESARFMCEIVYPGIVHRKSVEENGVSSR